MENTHILNPDELTSIIDRIKSGDANSTETASAIFTLKSKLTEARETNERYANLLRDKLGEGRLNAASSEKSYDFIGTILPPLDPNNSTFIPDNPMWITLTGVTGSDGNISSYNVRSWIDTRD